MGFAAVVPKPVPPNKLGAVEAGVGPSAPNGVAEFIKRHNSEFSKHS